MQASPVLKDAERTSLHPELLNNWPRNPEKAHRAALTPGPTGESWEATSPWGGGTGRPGRKHKGQGGISLSGAQGTPSPNSSGPDTSPRVASGAAARSWAAATGQSPHLAEKTRASVKPVQGSSSHVPASENEP